METVVEVKKRGRRPLVDRPKVVCVSMPTSMYEQVKTRAGDANVPQYVREVLRNAVAAV